MTTAHKDKAPYEIHQRKSTSVTHNVEGRNAAMATLEKDVLASLIAFMQSIIIVHSSSTQGSVHNLSATAVDGPEGKRFVSALKDLIGASVHAVSHPEGESTDWTTQERPDSKDMNITTAPSSYVDRIASGSASNDPDETELATVVLSIPPAVPPTELEAMTLTMTRAHVFNNMPLRLLAFDDNGSNLELIGRDEFFRHILPSVHAQTEIPEFQCKWIEALELRDFSVTIKPRYDRMNELITNAIGHGAHYAILSHTWIRGSPGDVVFSDWKNCISNPQGYAKISNFCRVAAHDHRMTLGWLDTVCINKDSSSELDESIRSMYRWYRGAHVCIIFLAETEKLDSDTHDAWFTRGWTLQELLAPACSLFYNKHWRQLGSTDSGDVQSLIEARTTITKRELDLCQKGEADDIPLSRRMQMASRRQVTREEDSSYSLLGLLGVDISVAYGEGAAHAFRRLFRELLATKKHILDLFNRTYFYNEDGIPSFLTQYSLRDTRCDYSDWGTHLDDKLLPEPISVTHLGLRIQCLLIPSLCSESEEDADYHPKGEFSLRMKTTVTLTSGEKLQRYYNMLDSRLYMSNLSTLPIFNATRIQNPLKTYAVINFDIKDDAVVVPKLCMGITMYTPDRPGTVGPSSRITILASPVPAFFRINTTRSTNSIPIRELENHGMQLATLYL